MGQLAAGDAQGSREQFRQQAAVPPWCGPQDEQRVPCAGTCHERANGPGVTGFELQPAPRQQRADCTLKQEIEEDSAENGRAGNQERNEESDQPLGEMEHLSGLRRARPQ